MIHVDGRRPGRRLTLSIWAVLAAIAVLALGLVMFGLSLRYDLADFHAVTGPSQTSYTADDNGAGGLALFVLTVLGLLLVGAMLVVVVVLTNTMVRGSRTAWRVTSGLTCAFALGCGALSLLGTAGTQDDGEEMDTEVVTVAHDPATTPWWARWSEVAGTPVLVGGAMLSTVALLLPATRRDLQARQRPVEPNVGGSADAGRD